jgi:hypothetical protein
VGEAAWQTDTLPANGSHCRYKRLAGPQDEPPKLECKLAGEPPAQLAARRWTGAGLPSARDGAAYKAVASGTRPRDLDPPGTTGKH